MRKGVLAWVEKERRRVMWEEGREYLRREGKEVFSVEAARSF